MAQRQEWSVRAVPLALHGDAVPVVSIGKPGCKSLDTYTMMGVLGRCTTLQLKILLFSIFEYCKAINQNMQSRATTSIDLKNKGLLHSVGGFGKGVQQFKIVLHNAC